MDEHERSYRRETNLDHWDVFAESTELTIEGHRLIAQEIGHEMKLLWRVCMGWLRDATGIASRRASPPA